MGGRSIGSKEFFKLNTKLDSFIKKLFIVGFLGLIISLGLAFIGGGHHGDGHAHGHPFFFSYITSFMFYLTISLGAMFIVLIHHITRSGWSVMLRRIPEGLMKNVSLLFLFSIPIMFGLDDLYHWAHEGAALHDHLLKVKEPFLNIPFFVIRLFIYFFLWRWIANKFFFGSVEQDETGDESITFALQRRSTYSLIIFAFTLTFAAVDLLMSITPHWYSTIFGVYIFAGATVGAYCLVSVILLFLRSRGFLADVVTHEHYHDQGKLIYGFNIFWTYIAFSQFFLIWYANIPEETLFYVNHFHGNWNTVAIILSIGHFVIPFIFLMSRHVKRNLTLHLLFAVWLLAMHFLDLYWIVMPNIFPEGIHVTLLDVSIFIGIGGIFLGVFFKRLKNYYLVPIKDPRLSESLNFENF
ncbi:quinol:cytochrome C oxidoreductase [Candidatus Marinamargulisbacteria bacterium SCGC AG-414-C22]|nr:quinol:cytochrome C oxidoreductase [Candidatus Marinamargulisbacteria bacterium SCGC AG-414-C22]